MLTDTINAGPHEPQPSRAPCASKRAAAIAALFLAPVMGGGEAFAVDIYQVEHRWATNLNVVELVGNQTSMVQKYGIARGEQITVALYLVNKESVDVDLTFDVEKMPGATDFFPPDAFEVRVMAWRDRAILWGIDRINGPLWSDQPIAPSTTIGNGFPDRTDFETIFPHPDTTTSSNTATTLWHEQTWYANSSLAGSSVRLYRDADPLPLFKADGIPSATLTIPANETRVLWLTVTAPNDIATGEYSGTPVVITEDNGIESVVQAPELILRVPCWDTFHVSQAEAQTWDYSYEPGRTNPEIDGFSLGPEVDARAAIRDAASHNTLYVPLGIASRDSVTSTGINTRFTTLLDRLETELLRHPAPSDPRRVDTIVLGMSGHGGMFSGDWGAHCEVPDSNGVWEARYEDLFVDLKAGLIARSIDPNDYRFIVIPVDEPMEFLRTDSNGDPINVDQYTRTMPCTLPVSCTAIDHDNNAATPPECSVSKRHLFRTAATVIRDLPSTALDMEILVPHHDRNNNSIDRLHSQFETCGHPSGDCVDIWSLGNWLSSDIPDMHPLNNSNYPSEQQDEFWWWQFGSHLSPLRYAQAGPLMYARGFDGQSNWAFWATGTGIGYAASFADPSMASAPQRNHSWNSTTPHLWGQENSAFLMNEDSSSILYDGSKPDWIPNLEAITPGRVSMAQRQSLELHRLLLSVGPYSPMVPQAGTTTLRKLYLTTTSSPLLDTIMEESWDSCHHDQTCASNEATIDDLAFVLRNWLGQGTQCEDEPGTVPYSGQSPTALDALGINPWQ